MANSTKSDDKNDPPGFIPLPSDPETPLTQDELEALFPNPGVWKYVIDHIIKSEALKVADMRVNDAAGD